MASAAKVPWLKSMTKCHMLLDGNGVVGSQIVAKGSTVRQSNSGEGSHGEGAELQLSRTRALTYFYCGTRNMESGSLDTKIANIPSGGNASNQ